MATVYGKELIMTRILENGTNLELMVMVFTLGQMVIGTRANGTFASSMEQVQIHLQAVIPTLVNTRMENLTVKANTLGQMVNSTLVNFKMEKSMAKDAGRALKKIRAMYMKGRFLMIRSTVKEHLLGPQEMFTKANTLTMRGMVSVR